MDGSFLSDTEVIAASRKFVCIRLSTYENAAEGKFLLNLFSGPTNNLENSVFAMLAPDGKTRLTRTGRSPSFAFGRDDAAIGRMARAMKRYSKRYPGNAATKTAPAAPTHPNLRLAINVAACDNRPLVLAFEPDAKKRAAATTALRDLAWHPETRGLCDFVTTGTAADLKLVRRLGTKPKPGIYVLRPSEFGNAARLLGQLETGKETTDATRRQQLRAAIRRYRPLERNQRDHVREGRRAGASWKTAIPVSDTRASGKDKRGRRR